MFSISISAHDTSVNFFKPLLTQADWWPIWLKDGEAWCLGTLPAWVLVEHEQGARVYRRQLDGYYLIEAVTEPIKAVLKAALACPSVHCFKQGFSGGLMGWLSYTDNNQHTDGIDFPITCFAYYDVFIRPDDQGDVHIFATNDNLAQKVLTQLQTSPPSAPFSLTSPFSHLMSKAQYTDAFTRVHGYLKSGDCYQVNLAQAFKARCVGDGIEAFIKLLALSQPPYAAYIHNCFGEVLSLSPELFLAFDEDGKVLTRPIKGTRPRKSNPQDDAAQLHDLATHPKDHAENLMIVDLLRHDLGKHAAIGSVRVPALFKVESFPQVHHLISSITCELADNSDALDLLFDAFPGGSITGAPKKRAMEIIAELENCQRAIYCGSIGYLTAEGRGQWNIAIRTLLRVGDAIYAWAGGGIVADSDCESEYEECFNKIGAMLRALENGG